MATIGYTSIGGTTDAAQSNWQPEAVIGAAERYTGVTGDTVTEVAVYGAGGAANVTVGIYVYSGGVPTTRVGSAVTVAVGSGAGWYTAAASIALTNGVEYCVAIDPYEDASWTYHYDPGTGNYSLHNVGNPVSLPATWTQGSGGGGSASVYATVTASALTVADAVSASTIDNVVLTTPAPPGGPALLNAVRSSLRLG